MRLLDYRVNADSLMGLQLQTFGLRSRLSSASEPDPEIAVDNASDAREVSIEKRMKAKCSTVTLTRPLIVVKHQRKPAGTLRTESRSQDLVLTWT